MNIGFYKVILAILETLLLVGCSQGNEFCPASFPVTGNASLEAIGGPMEINLPLDLCVDGNSVCVLAQTPEFWLHVYDRGTGVLLSEALPVGRGPGDAVNVMSMDYDRDAKLLYIHSPNLRKSVRYSFDGTAGKLQYVDEVHHPQDGVIRNVHLLPEGHFLYEGYMPEDDRYNRFFLYHDGEVTAHYQDYPGIEADDDRFAFLLSEGKSELGTGKFVFGTLYGGVLECFNMEEGSFDRTGLRLLDPPRMDLSQGGINMKKGTKWGFSNLCPTEDCIFANYIDGDDANVFTAVSVFGWNGKEKARYETGENILRMTADPDDGNALYGIVFNSEGDYTLSRIVLP